MELIHWWMLPVWLLAAAGVVVVLRRRGKARARTGGLAVANTGRLEASPQYRRLMTNYRRLVLGLLASVVLAALSAMVLSARFATADLDAPPKHNRDIMLCLDTSGSMTALDIEVIKSFRALASGLKGERVGLTIWNGTAISVFPLTDDYAYVGSELERAEKALTESDSSFTSGTLTGQGSSLIGDGLASCLYRFDKIDNKRARSIVFATDNELAGTPVMTLLEAATLAKDKDVRVYALGPKSSSSGDEETELQQAAALTEGSYHPIADESSSGDILKRISDQEATRAAGAGQLLRTDQPLVGLLVALVAVGALVAITWRLER